VLLKLFADLVENRIIYDKNEVGNLGSLLFFSYSVEMVFGF